MLLKAISMRRRRTMPSSRKTKRCKTNKLMTTKRARGTRARLRETKMKKKKMMSRFPLTRTRWSLIRMRSFHRSLKRLRTMKTKLRNRKRSLMMKMLIRSSMKRMSKLT